MSNNGKMILMNSSDRDMTVPKVRKETRELVGWDTVDRLVTEENLDQKETREFVITNHL